MNRLLRLVLALWVVVFATQSARADSSLVVNEIMYHPESNEAALEWVELYNQLAVDLDATGWSITGTISYSFPSNTVIRGRSFVVVAISPATLQAVTGATNLLGPFVGRLSNSGGTIQIRNNDGRVVDEVDYGTEGDWPVAPDGSGVSLAKIDRNTAAAPAANWTWSDQFGGTPGTDNFPAGAPAPRSLLFNEVASATNANFFVELVNVGTNTAILEGMEVFCDGATNSSYVFPPGTMVPTGGIIALNQSTLRFRGLSGDRLYLLPAERNQVLDAVDVRNKGRGRCAAFQAPVVEPNPPGYLGAMPWFNTAVPTPGASNSFAFHDEIVINEIMYHHQLLPPVAAGQAPIASSEAWIELHNRSTNDVNLTGWQIKGGISYTFPPNQILAADAYLVVAKDAAALRLLYPFANIVGDFSGKLSHNGDSLQVEDAAGNPVDKLHYYADGRWPRYADGGGSSLELRHPWAANSKAEAWAPSDESAKTSWQLYTYEAVAQNSGPDAQWSDLLLGLLGAGECLIDNISVIESPATRPTEIITNGDFESGATGWRFLGNHGQSRVETDPANPSNHVLHLISVGQQEHVSNHIERTLEKRKGLLTGLTYRISFRAKWLAGNNLLNTRLYFNRVARTTALPTPSLNGTPGARNSCYVSNPGPTYSFLKHSPVVPPPKKAVEVSVLVQDPQGVAACQLWWSVNGQPFSAVPMTRLAGSTGEFGDGQVAVSGTIPGSAVPGAIVQFYVEATDSSGAKSVYPARGAASGAFYMVDDWEERLDLGHNFRVIMSPANWALLRAETNMMTSAQMPTTVIWNEQRAYYDMGARLKGSPMGRAGDDRPSFHLEFQPDDLFLGAHQVLLLDASGRPGAQDQQAEIMGHHMMHRAGGIPFPQTDMGWCMALNGTNTGPIVVMPRFEDAFIGSAFPKGADGTLWLMELIYYPTRTNQYGYKLAGSTQVQGTDLAWRGDDKEAYRYYFLLKNHLAADDYSRLLPFFETLSLPNGPVLESQVHRVMDVDEWLRVFTFASLLGDRDWYTFGNAHNFFIYCRPGDNKMVALPWDLEQFYDRPADAPLIGDVYGFWTDVENIPANTRRMYAHVLEIFASTYNTQYMSRWVNHYASFAPGQDFSELLSYMSARRSAVLAEISRAGGNASFSVSAQTINASANNLVTISGTAPVQIQTIKVNGVEYPVTWTSVSSWKITVPVTAPSTVLTITGFDLRGLPYGQTKSVVVQYTGQPAPAASNLLINEVAWNPAIPGAEFVELVNCSSNTSFDLSNWRFDGLGYTFAPGTVISNGQYLVLARDQSAFIGAYGAEVSLFDTFGANLAPTGERLRLVRWDPAQAAYAQIVSQIEYSPSLPWPQPAPGESLQLMDRTQDLTRVCNWTNNVATPAAINPSAGSLPVFPTLWINEIQAENLTSITNSLGERTPWIELFNPGTNSVSLAGLYLSTNYTNLLAWPFPAGANIGPRQFKVLFADAQPGLSTLEQLHTSFSLAPRAGSLALSRVRNGKPEVLDFLNYTNLPPNRSFGSLPDGQCLDRAEFVQVTPGATNSTESAPLNVVINEWMAGNTNTLVDPVTGKYEDWFELFNAGTTPANLAGYYLTHSFTNQYEFKIPSGYVIPPGGFLLVWADKKSTNTTPDLHVNFKLSKTGTSIGLYAPNGVPIDYVTFGAQTSNISMGRYPDGATLQYFMPTPTPRTNNIIANTPPELDPIGTRFLYLGQVLQLTARATDAEDSWQRLTFSLPVGLPGAAIGPETGVFVWRADHVSVPSTNDFVVSVTDNGQPQLSDSQPFSVVILAPPSLGAVPNAGGGLAISFQTIPGQLYELHYKDDLNDPFWTILGSPVSGTGSVEAINDTSGSGPQRFYRLVISAAD